MKLSEGMALGRYVVEQPLGHGGAAEVWQVRHRLLGVRCALKVLTDADADDTSEAWLLHEGRAQAALAHPNLLPVREVLLLEGRPALLMPLVEGPDLDRLLATHRPSRAASLALLHAIVAGLGHAHGAGLVHRDLKPSNVLLSLRGGAVCPRIADFGLVKIAGVDKTTAGVGFGTPAYAAPEQLWDAAAVDARADLFSLGVLLVELLTGQRPFTGDSIAQLVAAHAAPPRLGGLTGPLRALAARLLQPEPALRPASCAEVAAALGAPDAAALGAGSPLWQAAAKLRRVAGGPMAEDSPPQAAAPSALPRHNLPAPRGAFVGRRQDLAALEAALQVQRRLIVLLGPGGVGKTRLALESARGEAAREAWPGGVWFVDLSEARSRDGLLSAAGQALGVQLRGDADARLAAALQARGRALYVLDNVEQVAAHAEALIGRWHDQAPGAVFVITSRLPLRIGGELSVGVAPLSEADAVALFAARAQRAVTPADRALLPALARALDGLPLAIELAATRAREVPLSDMLDRIDAQRLALRATRGGTPPRQRSLRATLQWSWALLSPAAQATLAQCSIFEGGFTLADAEAVVSIEDAQVSAALSSLCEQHLLQTRPGPWSGATRLSMLRAVQQFAAEQRDEHAALAGRHADHFATLCPDTRALHRAGGDVLLGTLREQLGNLVAGMAHGGPESAVGCAVAAAQVFVRAGPIDSGLRHLRALRRRHGGALRPQQHARLDMLEARLVSRAEGYTEALALLGRSLDAHAETRPEAEILRGNALIETGQGEAARRLLDQTRADAQQRGDRWIAAEASVLLGSLRWFQGDLEAARAHLVEGLSLLEALGDLLGEMRCRGNYSNCLLYLGEVDAALRGYERTLQIAHRLGDRSIEATCMSCLAMIHRQRSEARRASRCYALAVQLSEHIGDQRGADGARGYWARLLRDRGQLHEARELVEAALTSARASGNRWREHSFLGTLSTICQQLGEHDRADHLIERGLLLAREIGDQRSESRHHVNRARALQHAGRMEEARAALQEALSQSGAFQSVGTEHSALALLHRALGELDEARDCFIQAAADAREADARYLLGTWLAELAETHLQRDEDDDAAPLLDEAEAIMRQIDFPVLLARVLGVRAHAALRRGQHAAATQAAQEAGAILDTLRMPPAAVPRQQLAAITARVAALALS